MHKLDLSKRLLNTFDLRVGRRFESYCGTRDGLSQLSIVFVPEAEGLGPGFPFVLRRIVSSSAIRLFNSSLDTVRMRPNAD